MPAEGSRWLSYDPARYKIGVERTRARRLCQCREAISRVEHGNAAGTNDCYIIRSNVEPDGMVMLHTEKSQASDQLKDARTT